MDDVKAGTPSRNGRDLIIDARDVVKTYESAAGKFTASIVNAVSPMISDPGTCSVPGPAL